MGLDITIKRAQRLVCPKCGELVGHREIEEAYSGGRAWYELLEKFGYYVPYDQRTEENDWYGKDMVLTPEQAKELYKFVRKGNVFLWYEVATVIAYVLMNDDEDVIINADW